jgi:hypothetical protein
MATAKGCKILHLELCRRISNQRKACRVRLWKAIQGKGADVLNDIVLGGYIDVVGGHASTELSLQILHALPGATHPYRAPQLLGLRTCEVGYGRADRRNIPPTPHQPPPRFLCRTRHESLRLRWGASCISRVLGQPHLSVYPHVPGLGVGSGIIDKCGHELEFPSAFRQSRRDGSPRGIIKIKYGGSS